MAEKIRELRISRKLPAKDMVAVVQELYPKYDKTMQSKCERGDEYGIQIRKDALEALYARFAPELLKKKDGHKYTCRISCRLPDDDYADLQEFIRGDGFDTMQAWLTYTVRKYLKRKRKVRKEREDK